jgi:hypothetical protein
VTNDRRVDNLIFSTVIPTSTFPAFCSVNVLLLLQIEMETR